MPIQQMLLGPVPSPSGNYSVDFDGVNDYLSIPDNSAWDISSSDATSECWTYFDTHNGHDGIIHNLHSSGFK